MNGGSSHAAQCKKTADLILRCALDYIEEGLRVFPCNWRSGATFKHPLVADWNEVATRDPVQVEAWWLNRPQALIGAPTGTESGFCVLDVDCKNGAWGFDGLAYLGFAILPNTRMAHTASGGLHMYFHPGDHGIRNTAGKKGRGIGAGLDWRGDGGFVILPSPASGYWWDPHYGLDFPLAPVPLELLPREVKPEPAKSVERAAGLSPYAEAAVASACRNITHADAGTQEDTLHRECFSIGTLVAAEAAPEGWALRMLLAAAAGIRDYDPRRPWRAGELESKVTASFNRGLVQPRSVREGPRHG